MITYYKKTETSIGYYYIFFPEGKFKFEERNFQSTTDKLNYMYSNEKELIARNLEVFANICSEHDDSQLTKEFVSRIKKASEWVSTTDNNLNNIRSHVHRFNQTFVVLLENMRDRNPKLNAMYHIINDYCIKGRNEI
jgi:hypothetical protein